MPFQAIPIAFRQNPGSPLAKLLLVYLVHKAMLVGGYRRAYAYCDPTDAAKFCQCREEELEATFETLARMGFIGPHDGQDERDKWLFPIVHLPLSDLADDDRKRIKCTPDQIDLIARRDGGYFCAACGKGGEDDDEWHVDHIIPRSVRGADVEANCQLLCPTCNARKGAKVHWVDFLGGRK